MRRATFEKWRWNPHTIPLRRVSNKGIYDAISFPNWKKDNNDWWPKVVEEAKRRATPKLIAKLTELKMLGEL